MEHKRFYTFTVMLFYIQMKAGSCKQQCNNDVIRELIQTLDGNAILDAINAPTKMAQPFTAIQLTDKHVRFCDFLDLCQEICKEEKPEVVTIITVKKYYDDESDTSKDSFEPTFISAIQNYFVFGNDREICNNPSIVTVHIIKKAFFNFYNINEFQRIVYWVMIKHLNTLAIEYIDKNFADFMYNSLMTEVKRCIIFAAVDFFKRKAIRNYVTKFPTAKSPYAIFTERLKKAYILTRYKYRFEREFARYKAKEPFYKTLLDRIESYWEEIKSKTGIEAYFWNEILFGILVKAKFRFAMCNVYFGIKQKLFNHVLKSDYSVGMSNLMSGTFDILAQVLQSEYDNFHLCKKDDDILFNCLDNQCDQEQLSMFYKELFSNHDIKAIISDEIAKSDLLTKTKLNNDLYTANSTKIILNKELSKEMLPSLCQTLQEIKIFERFDTQQNVYINFDKPDINLIRNATYMLETKGKLRTITDPSNLLYKHAPYEYIFTSVNTYDNENIISRVPLILDFDSDTKIKKQKIVTSSINLIQNTSFSKVDKFGVNDYHGSISHQAIYYIDNAILITNREIVGVYKISKRNNLSGKNGEEIVIIHHRNIEGQNDEKVSIIYETEIEKSHKQIDTYGETTKKFKCFHNVSRSLLVSVKKQTELLRLTPAKFTIPNYFESDDTDYYYKTVTMLLKHNDQLQELFVLYSKCFDEEKVDYYNVYTNKFLGHIGWDYDIASKHDKNNPKRAIKLEELRYIVDKCLIKECSKYIMVNCETIHHYPNSRQCMYVFTISLDERRTIVNFYYEQDVIRSHDANRFDVAARILHLIYKDKYIRVGDACLRRLRLAKDLNKPNLLQLITELIDRFRYLKDFTTCRYVHYLISENILKLLGYCIVHERSAEELDIPEKINEPKSLKSLALHQTTKTFVYMMTRRIIKTLYEYFEYKSVKLITVVVNRKKQEPKTAAPGIPSADLQPADNLLELLEEHSSRFVTAIKNNSDN